jgi:type IV pilus assembly protein PilA
MTGPTESGPSNQRLAKFDRRRSSRPQPAERRLTNPDRLIKVTDVDLVIQMHAKTQLELLRKLRQRPGLAKGFTLVELMIVVAIVGILSAVVMPRFLGARGAAEAGARIGQAVGLAKECSVYIAGGAVGSLPTAASSGNVTGSCNSTAGTYAATFSAAAGLNCLSTSNSNASTQASIGVDAAGAMTCTLS